MPFPSALRAVHVTRLQRSFPAALISLACFAASSARAFLVVPRTATTTYRRTSPIRRSKSCHYSVRSGPTTDSIPTAGWSSDRYRVIPRTRAGVAPLSSVIAPGIEKVSSGLGELLHPRNGVNERYVFFGGKGGVGKTSTAAAVAIQCADAGLR